MDEQLHLSRMVEQGITQERLVDWYSSQGKTVRQIARGLGISRNTVAFALQHFGIVTRGRSEAAKVRSGRDSYQKARSASLKRTYGRRPELREQMSQRMSARVGDRNPRWIGGEFRTEAWLREHYECQTLTLLECAALAGCGETTMARWLRVHGISVRHQVVERRSCEVCSKQVDQDAKRFCSRQCAGKGNAAGRRGSGNKNWRGGLSGERAHWYGNGGAEWRKHVLNLAGGACMVCGDGQEPLHAHHKAGFTEYPEHRADVRNGACLCFLCHCVVHSEAGRELRQQWEEEFLSLVRVT